MKGQTGREIHNLVVKNNFVVKKSTIFTKIKWKKTARNSPSCCRVYISLSKSINLQIISFRLPTLFCFRGRLMEMIEHAV